MTSKGTIQLKRIYVWEATHDEIDKGCHGYPSFRTQDHSTFSAQVGVEEAAKALQKRGFVTWNERKSGPDTGCYMNPINSGIQKYGLPFYRAPVVSFPPYDLHL